MSFEVLKRFGVTKQSSAKAVSKAGGQKIRNAAPRPDANKPDAGDQKQHENRPK